MEAYLAIGQGVTTLLTALLLYVVNDLRSRVARLENIFLSMHRADGAS